MNGEFTYYADIADKEQLQLIMDNWFELESQGEIQKSLKNSADVIQNVGRYQLRSIAPFKYSKAQPGIRTGHLINSIGNKTIHNKAKFEEKIGFRRGKGGGNHAHLIDRGTANRYTKKGYYRGSIKAGSPNTGEPFWTKTVESQGPRAMERLNDAIYTTLQRISNRK